MEKNRNNAVEENNNNMSTLSSCMASLLKKGYDANLQIREDGLEVAGQHKSYTPEQVHIDDFYRFEGNSNPADNAILYAIQTNDGVKGTLVDAYGSDANQHVAAFLKEVKDIKKGA